MTSYDVTLGCVIIIIIIIIISSSNSVVSSGSPCITHVARERAPTLHRHGIRQYKPAVFAPSTRLPIHHFYFPMFIFSLANFPSLCVRNHYTRNVFLSLLRTFLCVLSAAAACRPCTSQSKCSLCDGGCSVCSRSRNLSDGEAVTRVRPSNTCQATVTAATDLRLLVLQVDNLPARRSRTPLVMHVAPFQCPIYLFIYLLKHTHYVQSDKG